MFGRRAFTENERSIRQLQLSTMIREPEKFMQGEPVQSLIAWSAKTISEIVEISIGALTSAFRAFLRLHDLHVPLSCSNRHHTQKPRSQAILSAVMIRE